MKFLYERISKPWRDSITAALALFTIVATVMSVTGISLDKINHWCLRLLIVFTAFTFLLMVSRFVIWLTFRKGIRLKIRNIPVAIRQGDIFQAQDGWKLIPFNEYFDTQVDDIVIAKSSLNGKFIERIGNLSSIKKAIATDEGSPLNGEDAGNNRVKYPLGRIKRYNDFLLLAFTHFNQHYEAHLSWSEYECCLRQMWQEISRIHAGKNVYLPLLGAGITRFDDKTEKSEFELLKCMLCTLRTSNVHINKPITILLTKEVMQGINIYIYELKGVR